MASSFERGRAPVEWLSLLAVALFAYTVVPASIQNVTTARTSAVTTAETVQAPLAASAGTALTAVVLLVAVVGVLASIRRIRWGWWMVAAMLPFAAQCIALLYGIGSLGPQQLVYPAVVLVAGAMVNPGAVGRTLGWLTVLLAAASLSMTVVLPTQAFYTLSSEKALFGSLLAGPLYHPNSLGQMMALGLPFVLMLRRKSQRVLGFVAVAVTLVWSGSRTGMIAAGLAVAIMLCWRMANGRSELGRWIGVPLALLGYAAAVVIGPALVADATGTSFTDRGQIWTAAIARWETSPVTGMGPGFFNYEALFRNDLGSGAFHAHNLGVHMLTTAGVLGVIALAIYVLLLLSRSWNAGRAGAYAIAAYVPALLADGWLELPTDFFSLGSNVWITWIPLALVASGAFTRRLQNNADQGERPVSDGHIHQAIS